MDKDFHKEFKKCPQCGSEAPGFGIMTDVCIGCGCIYAIDLTRIDKKKSLPPAQIIPPGKSQKGRPLINPFSPS